jgi:hypothetical protein
MSRWSPNCSSTCGWRQFGAVSAANVSTCRAARPLSGLPARAPGADPGCRTAGAVPRVRHPALSKARLPDGADAFRTCGLLLRWQWGRPTRRPPCGRRGRVGSNGPPLLSRSCRSNGAIDRLRYGLSALGLFGVVAFRRHRAPPSVDVAIDLGTARQCRQATEGWGRRPPPRDKRGASAWTGCYPTDPSAQRDGAMAVLRYGWARDQGRSLGPSLEPARAV